MNLMISSYPYLAKIECKIKFLRLNVSMLDDNNDICVSGGFYYVINMFNLRSAAPLVKIPFNYTNWKFTILKKLTFPRGGNLYQLCGCDRTIFFIKIMDCNKGKKSYKSTTINSAWSKMQKHDVLMVQNIFKSSSRSGINKY